MSGYLGCRGIFLLRPVLLAVFGALAWLLWLAGPSQAADILPTIPAVPSPSVTLPPVPLAVPIGPLVNHVPSAVPSPSQLATVPESVVNQLTDHALTPVVGLVDAVPPMVTNTISELPALPELPSVPALPPVPGILPPQGPSASAVPAAPMRAGSGAVLTAPTPLVPTSPLSPSVQAGPGANTGSSGFTRNPGFMPDGVFMPAAVFATAEVSPGPGGPPPDTPAPAAVSPHESGSMSDPQGGSAFGAADLPEQRALAPPLHHGPIPDGRQTPSAEPAFDPGSSPD